MKISPIVYGAASSQVIKPQNQPDIGNSFKAELNVSSERLASIQNEKFHLEPPKKVDQTRDFGRLEDYLRFEEGIVNAIDNIKVYIKAINHEYIKETDAEADKLVDDYILNGNRLKEYQDQGYKHNNLLKNYSEIGVKALKENVDSLSKLYGSYSATVSRLFEQNQSKKISGEESEKSHTKSKSDKKILDLLNNRRQDDLKESLMVNAIEVKRNEVTNEVSSKDAETITGNFDFSQEKFNKKFFEKLLLGKLEEIENSFKTTEKIKESLETGNIEKALDFTEFLKTDRSIDLSLKEFINSQRAQNYNKSAQYLRFEMNTPLIDMSV